MPTIFKNFTLGVKNLILLEVTGTDKENFPEGETHSSFDVLNDNFLIPPEKTYYNCRLLKLPDFPQKQHVVKVLICLLIIL